MKYDELFDKFVKSIAKIVSDEIDNLDIERTAYGYIVAKSDDDEIYSVRRQGDDAILTELPNCSSRNNLTPNSFVTIKYVGKNLSTGYISRVNRMAENDANGGE